MISRLLPFSLSFCPCIALKHCKSRMSIQPTPCPCTSIILIPNFIYNSLSNFQYVFLPFTFLLVKFYCLLDSVSKSRAVLSKRTESFVVDMGQKHNSKWSDNGLRVRCCKVCLFGNKLYSKVLIFILRPQESPKGSRQL